VGPHPHRGLETVTLAYSGSVEHHDSHGGGGVISQGEVQWMTAGAGLLHKEFYETDFNTTGGDFQMVQLWLNLPAKDKMTPPNYQSLKDFEKFKFPGGYVEVIAGEFRSIVGKATTFSPVNVFNIAIEQNSKFTFELPHSHNSGLLVLEGAIRVNDQKINTNSLVFFGTGVGDIRLEASTDSLVLVLSGEPIDEPIASYGPFLMNTTDEIRQAFRDFQNGAFGALE
jgi:quercetin 2,3-dioxygenase